MLHKKEFKLGETTYAMIEIDAFHALDMALDLTAFLNEDEFGAKAVGALALLTEDNQEQKQTSELTTFFALLAKASTPEMKAIKNAIFSNTWTADENGKSRRVTDIPNVFNGGKQSHMLAIIKEGFMLNWGPFFLNGDGLRSNIPS